jgi:hypothetical protein
MAIRLKVQDNDLKLKVGETSSVKLKATEVIGNTAEEYTGEYTVTPSTSQQTLHTDGLLMTDDVTVEAVPIAEASRIEEKVSIGKMTVDSKGVVTAAMPGLVKDVYPVERAGYADEGFHALLSIGEAEGTLELPTEAGKIITPTTSQQTAAHGGTYNTGDIFVGAIPPQYIIPTGKKTITANGTDIDVAQYATADVAVPQTLTDILLRDDCTLVQKWTLDKLVVTDESKTIPAYSTSAQTVIAAKNLSPTITLDYANYKYYVLERFLTIPVYNTNTKEKGRPDCCMSSYLYEIVELEANTLRSASGSPSYASRSVAIASQTVTRAPYWSAASTMGIYTATTYTASQVASTPTVSSGVLTCIAPSLQMRGSTTYFTSSAWGKITDIRRQYVIEVYRSPKDHLNLNGWGTYQHMLKIAGCINGTTNKLV